MQYSPRLQNILTALKQFSATKTGSPATTPGKPSFDLNKLDDDDGKLTQTTTVVSETIIGAAASTHDQGAWEDDKYVNSESNTEPHTPLSTPLDTQVRPKTFEYTRSDPSAIAISSSTNQSWGTPNQRNYLFSNTSIY